MDCFAPAYLPDGDAFVCHGGPRPAASLADFPGPLTVAGSPQLRALGDRTVTLTGVRSAFASPPHPTRDQLALRPGPTAITLVATDGSAPSRLLDLQGTVPLAPAISSSTCAGLPTGVARLHRRAVRRRRRRPGRHLEGARRRQGLVNLTPRTRGNDGFAEFSPDGRRLLFRSGRDGTHDLYLMDADGGEVRRLTSDAGSEVFPAFSPTGRQIAFASDRDSPDVPGRPRTFDLYTMELGPDGGPGAVRRITATDAQEAHVQYSPDGAWLVFTSGMGGITDEEPLVQAVIFNPQSYGEI